MEKILYCVDADCQKGRASLNNDPNVYFSELFELMGVTAVGFTAETAAAGLKEASFLFVGSGNYGVCQDAFETFVQEGGTLAAFGSEGLDVLCGVKRKGTIRNASEFSENGHLNFAESAYAPKLDTSIRLPVISDILHCSFEGTPLAFSEEYKIPLVWERACGRGKTIYFAFSLLQTMWYQTQGRPVYEDLNGDGYCRSSDAIVRDLTDDFSVPAADLYLHFLENLLWKTSKRPLVHQLPPDSQGKPCDFILHFSGDEDHCGSRQIEAVQLMQSRRIPYHIHLQPADGEKEFKITKPEFGQMEKMGAEFSLHLDFVTDKSFHYDELKIKRQLELYLEKFEKMPGVLNTHWFLYEGFGETSRWLSKMGIKGTLRQIGSPSDLSDINKMNVCGFAFGTSYPTHDFDDAAHLNVRHPVINQKIIFYEPRKRSSDDDAKISQLMKISKELALMTNIFIHPVYLIDDKEATLAAVDQILRLGKRYGAAVLSSDQLAEWWISRGKSRLEKVGENDFEGDFYADCVLKFPQPVRVSVDGEVTETYMKQIAGRDCYLAVVSAGHHRITVI